MNLETIYQRVAAWNAKRYDRTYNHELTMNLLYEEFNEGFEEGITPVQVVDAWCDLTYVAFGGLWKLDLTDEEVHSVLMEGFRDAANLITAAVIDAPASTAGVLHQLKHENEYPVALGLATVIALSFMQLTYLTSDQAIEAIMIVCDSNDTKSVQKTASDVKANIDKGNFFVAPEPRLQALLEKADEPKSH